MTVFLYWDINGCLWMADKKRGRALVYRAMPGRCDPQINRELFSTMNPRDMFIAACQHPAYD